MQLPRTPHHYSSPAHYHCNSPAHYHCNSPAHYHCNTTTATPQHTTTATLPMQLPSTLPLQLPSTLPLQHYHCNSPAHYHCNSPAHYHCMQLPSTSLFILLAEHISPYTSHCPPQHHTASNSTIPPPHTAPFNPLHLTIIHPQPTAPSSYNQQFHTIKSSVMYLYLCMMICLSCCQSISLMINFV